MAVIEQVKLSEFFRSVKRPRYILGTTYTLSLAFFESVVFPYIDRHELKYCLVISDNHGYCRALDEGAALQGAAQGYMVVPAPSPGCFHAKVWLLIGESEAALLVGSGNLTQSGFMTNVELFDSLTFSKESPPTREQFTEIRTFLSGLIGMWAEEDRGKLLCVDMLAEMRREFGSFSQANGPAAPKAPRFVHSFAGTIVDQLPERTGASKLYIAAPFFGNSTAGIDILCKRFRPKDTKVFPAVHDEGTTTDLPLKKASKKRGVALARLGLKGKRGFAHLKLYGLAENGRNAWIFCTSANCTEAALTGKNVEAGILRWGEAKTLAPYFTADKRALPDGIREYSADVDDTNRIHLWACETGMGVDISVSHASAPRLPLTEVSMTVRSGSSIAIAQRSQIFAERRTEHVLWTAFEDLHLTRNMAVCIQITGLDSKGKQARGACFVENRMLLAADPLHRSAWRAALSLLDRDSMPDLSDIAAIFTLVSNIFDGRLVSRSTVSYEPKAEEEDQEEKAVIHIPIWPPQADTSDLHRRIGTTGLGQLSLCQKILETLLKPQPHHAAKRIPQSSLDETEGDSEEDASDAAEAQSAREEPECRTIELAQLLWERVSRDYRRLHNRLQTLCPDAELAPNIWPAAIFVFLATAAVHRATSRVATNLDERIAMHLLVGQFVRLMLNKRKQPEDFCCPKGFRYRNDDHFPPLADDLREVFRAEPDVDLATVMVASLVAYKMHIAPSNKYPVLWQSYLRQVVGSNFRATPDFQDASRRIWSQYLHEDTSKATNTDFDAAYATMWQAYTGENA